MVPDVRNYYKKLLKSHGFSLAALHWNHRGAQYKRFEILSCIDPQMKSVVDIGCGLGDMAGYLCKKNYRGQYLGLDFVEEFIDFAKKKFSKNFNFRVFDVWKENIPTGYDYVVLSGVFNVKTRQSKKFMLQTISKMFKACKKGVAFNVMSTYVDYQDKLLYYSNPLEIFDYCKKYLTRRVVLRHDYVVKKGAFPYEYTMYLYKDGK